MTAGSRQVNPFGAAHPAGTANRTGPTSMTCHPAGTPGSAGSEPYTASQVGSSNAAVGTESPTTLLEGVELEGVELDGLVLDGTLLDVELHPTHQIAIMIEHRIRLIMVRRSSLHLGSRLSTQELCHTHGS